VPKYKKSIKYDYYDFWWLKNAPNGIILAQNIYLSV
jgi:hypothetical protein